ncbi:MAG: tRNA lysidine(34) synthetase TilS [Reichenbachiella sp.]
MDQLSKKVKAYIKNHSLFQATDKLLLTVSGGIDSICMAHILHELQYDITVAHCNFQLRQMAADEDQQFVQGLCQQLDIPFITKSFDTSTYADTHHVSIQMAARDLRYEWFDEVLKENDLQYILTAHHANDALETCLFNLTKGTGISGLKGIDQQPFIKRPLLCCTKEEINQYAADHNISWREDVSNSSNKYHRNSIRNQVIPLLKKINPNIEHTYTQNVRRYSALESLLKNQAVEIVQKYMRTIGTDQVLDTSWYDADKGSFAVLDQILKPYGFVLDQIINIETCLLNAETGKTFQANQHALLVDRKQIIISTKTSSGSINKTHITIASEVDTYILNDKTLTFTQAGREVTIDRNPHHAYLDADKITYPITIRNWELGDWFIPLGMSGKKKLSDFMIDKKIPLNLKQRILVFESENNIFWIEGQRIDNRFKVTDQTKNILIIKSTSHV